MAASEDFVSSTSGDPSTARASKRGRPLKPIAALSARSLRRRRQQAVGDAQVPLAADASGTAVVAVPAVTSLAEKAKQMGRPRSPDEQISAFAWKQRRYRARLLQLWADLLSVGVASFGHIGGTHYQNHHDFDPYVEQLGNGDLPVYRALTPSDDERLIREFILQLKLGSVSLQYFTEKFGTNPAERFAVPLQRIADWGFLSIEGDRVNINREGLLQVDRLLHEFFLPEHRNARYA